MYGVWSKHPITKTSSRNVRTKKVKTYDVESKRPTEKVKTFDVISMVKTYSKGHLNVASVHNYTTSSWWCQQTSDTRPINVVSSLVVHDFLLKYFCLKHY
jgi:hypothetical protein